MPRWTVHFVARKSRGDYATRMLGHKGKPWFLATALS